MNNSDRETDAALAEALECMERVYRERGIFQDEFGFGDRPAIVVVDFAYGWTDESYAGGTARLDEPIANTRLLLAEGRKKKVPIIYTTSPWRPNTADQSFKSAADFSQGFRVWDQRAVMIDERVAPEPNDLVIQKENASAFFGTHLVSYLTQLRVDTVLITGCSTSACIRATATDAKSYRFRPIIVRECVGDRSAVAHAFTLSDVRARFADVRRMDETVSYLQSLAD